MVDYEKKRIYQLADEQTTIVDTDLGVLDKNGYTKAKKYTMLNLYNYIASKLGVGAFTSKAFHKLYVKSTADGLEFKGSPGDYTPIENDELDGLTVEIVKSVDGVIVANAMTSVAGLTANTIRNTSIGTPNVNAKVVYYDVDTETLATILLSDLGGGSNIATNDLLFTQNSITDFDGYTAIFDNASVKIISNADGFNDIPFEVTKADGVTFLYRCRANGYHYFTGDVIDFTKDGLQPAVTVSSTGSASNYGPDIKYSDANGTILRIFAIRNNNTRISNEQTEYSITQSIKPISSVGFSDALFENGFAGLFYEDTGTGTANAVIKFKKANGEKFTATILAVNIP